MVLLLSLIYIFYFFCSLFLFWNDNLLKKKKPIYEIIITLSFSNFNYCCNLHFQPNSLKPQMRKTLKKPLSATSRISTKFSNGTNKFSPFPVSNKLGSIISILCIHSAHFTLISFKLSSFPGTQIEKTIYFLEFLFEIQMGELSSFQSSQMEKTVSLCKFKFKTQMGIHWF